MKAAMSLVFAGLLGLGAAGASAQTAPGDPAGNQTIPEKDFEMFRPDLDAALAYSDGAQSGRPPFDPVMMFKVPRHSGGEQSLR